MRRISVPLYAPILVMVIVVALVNVGGVALSPGSGNRGENVLTPVRVANQFIPAGTPLEHLEKLMTSTSIPIPIDQARQNQTINAVLKIPKHVVRRSGRLSGVVTSVDIYRGQQFTQPPCGVCTVLR